MLPKFLLPTILLLAVLMECAVAIGQTSAEIMGTASPTPTAPPQTLSTSPDRNFYVRREQAEFGDHGEARKRIEICSASGKELYSWISGLGATTLLWSPDAHYLAVNDRPGVGGDLLRIFYLDPGMPGVTLLREPDGKRLLSEEESRHGSFFSTVENVHLEAFEWREGHLWCLLTGSAHPKREPMIHVPFHHLWVFGVQGIEEPHLLEEWTRTDPKEMPVRDSAE